MSEARLRSAYALLEQKEYLRAIAQFEACLEHRPEIRAFALNGLGLCAEQQDRFVDAEKHYRQALELLPQEGEILNNLAICLQIQGRYADSLHYFDRMRQIHPNFRSHFNYARAALSFQRYWESLLACVAALRLNPQHTQTVVMLYQLSVELFPARFGDLEAMLHARPEDPILCLCTAFHYLLQTEYQRALTYLKTAFRIAPALYESYSGAVTSLLASGQHEDALALAKLFYFYEPSGRSLAQAIITCQKNVYQSRAELEHKRQELKSLLKLFQAEVQPLAHRPFMRPQLMNFYHAYQGYADLELQQELARAFLKVTPQIDFVHHPQRPPRVGFLSIHFRDHSVMHLLQAAVEHLMGAEDFDSYLLLLPSEMFRHDHVTAQLKACADHVVPLSGQHLTDVERIAELHLDILIYLDIGMESLSYFLALNRLARHQLVLPGHPISTGLPDMDYFISSAALEPANGERFYSEKLVTLSGLPDYQPPEIPPRASPERLGLPAGNLYFCPMTIFKVHPDMDRALQGILEQDSEGQILFLANRNHIHRRLARRLRAHLGDELYQRVHFLPWTERPVFFQRMMACDVILDTFYFGGGNTSYQAFGLGCPIVALDVPWNKGRWTQAMYRLMEIEGCVATDPEHYVSLAVELARDTKRQQALRQLILERSSILFNNSTWSQGLLDFCRSLLP